MRWGEYWKPYVSVAQKKALATKAAAVRAKREKRAPEPVQLAGRKLATTFWGMAWCNNLEAYRDYANRLPRGAAYVRNGSVADLVIRESRVDAVVAGSKPYEVEIAISKLPRARWDSIRNACSKSIDSLLDLLSGKLSDGVMRRLTDQKKGLFPAPSEIKMHCSCPDWSTCCKHIAAVMYGIGSRLDNQPELLFLLRGVDHQELVSHAMACGNLNQELEAAADPQFGGDDLSSIFGIELDQLDATPEAAGAGTKKATRKSTKKARTTAKQTTRSRRKSSDGQSQPAGSAPRATSRRPAKKK